MDRREAVFRFRDDDNEKRSMVARSAREGSVDAASLAPPVLRETMFGHREKDKIVSCLSVDLFALRGTYS
jgi:hypothetical protein